eukprot:TRINITY_DN2871_c0_g1_i8.p1 TRINITY_DN2871_c0_g1~~TRINITY_DN2871_c0_g1_i8.p1  ORF type:complete len:170 (-),score=88.41 TRINITY_DN2871_c0_g1_i8:296-733(-)
MELEMEKNRRIKEQNRKEKLQWERLEKLEKERQKEKERKERELREDKERKERQLREETLRLERKREKERRERELKELKATKELKKADGDVGNFIWLGKGKKANRRSAEEKSLAEIMASQPEKPVPKKLLPGALHKNIDDKTKDPP